MTESMEMPNSEKIKETLARSRHRRKELELLQIELEELIATLESESREQRQEQLQKYFNSQANFFSP